MTAGIFENFKEHDKKIFDDMGIDSGHLSFHTTSGAGGDDRVFSAVRDALAPKEAFSASIEPSEQQPSGFRSGAITFTTITAETVQRKIWTAIAVPVLVIALVYMVFAILL